MPDLSQPDLAAVARTDRLIDALANRRPVDLSDPGDEALAVLLADWRDDLRWPPASALVSDRQAVAALERGLAERPTGRRRLALVGSVAAALLTLGGFGAMVGGAQPGDALYGVHAMLFGEPQSAHDDRVELAAKTEIEQVQQMISQGQWDQAQDKLAALSTSVQSVNDSTRKQNLIDQVNQLNAKVSTRDPNATAAPSSSPNPVVAPVTSTTASVSSSDTSAETTTSLPTATTSLPTTTTSPAATTPTPSATPTSSPSAVASTSPTSPSPASTSSTATSSPAAAPTASATTPPTSAETSGLAQPPSPASTSTRP
ncbi:anti-sigma-D factor RsdA [Mycobacterium celatum]|uniref:Anti-sigma-D factor RsdA sigma factor binding region domain-containing protein n=1 Tax=Mycobacterium celatum TaxID=28045 RepID=A0A1X1RS92_MYCCE|nr:anti-sigma-D factor RsdA [Mycobacterium celatum]ORV14687.1 hypothetical protein AWB95_08645 [Mycobacterium celatum]PIB76419.1 hypothetical protein CQY23_18490 [Mycobacterium celatum]